MPPIRTSYRNIGGPFPGRGSAPAMTKDFHLVGGKASFERFNDEAAMRTHAFDAGSLVAANDNEPQTKTKRNRKEATR
jgi:hypothetical protein